MKINKKLTIEKFPINKVSYGVFESKVVAVEKLSKKLFQIKYEVYMGGLTYINALEVIDLADEEYNLLQYIKDNGFRHPAELIAFEEFFTLEFIGGECYLREREPHYLHRIFKGTELVYDENYGRIHMNVPEDFAVPVGKLYSVVTNVKTIATDPDQVVRIEYNIRVGEGQYVGAFQDIRVTDMNAECQHTAAYFDYFSITSIDNLVGVVEEIVIEKDEGNYYIVYRTVLQNADGSVVRIGTEE